MRLLRNGIALACVATMLNMKPVFAQSSPIIQLTPGTLRGIVLDTLGNPIANVEVVLTQMQAQVRTGADGMFQFDSVKVGTYDISARRLGYIAKGYQVRVAQHGGAVEIRMIPIGNTLASVTTVAQIGGVSGVIADTAFRALKGVKVSVLGVAKTMETDSAGAFFIPLNAGNYMLRIEHDGFSRQIKGVMIPENEGRKIAIWLTPLSGPKNNVEAASLFDLNARMLRGSGASTKFSTREDLERLSIPDLLGLVRNWASGRVTTECSVYIGGVPFLKIPANLLLVSEIEFAEVYLPTIVAGGTSTRRITTSINGSPTRFKTPTGPARPAPLLGCGNVAVVAWLRQ